MLLTGVTPQKICERVDLGEPETLNYCPDRCRTQEISEKAIKKVLECWNVFLISMKPKRRVKELF